MHGEESSGNFQCCTPVTNILLNESLVHVFIIQRQFIISSTGIKLEIGIRSWRFLTFFRKQLVFYFLGGNNVYSGLSMLQFGWSDIMESSSATLIVRKIF